MSKNEVKIGFEMFITVRTVRILITLDLFIKYNNYTRVCQLCVLRDLFILIIDLVMKRFSIRAIVLEVITNKFYWIFSS